jgi:hypothetical protein
VRNPRWRVRLARPLVVAVKQGFAEHGISLIPPGFERLIDA